jgi:serine/threonine protein kinase
VIADFGITTQGTEKAAHTEYSRGSSGYRAPELVAEEFPTFSIKVDIWALGCILFELVIGKPTFRSDYDLFAFISNGSRFEIPHFTRNLDWQSGIMDILESIFQRDPKKRPVARELRNVLEALRQIGRGYGYVDMLQIISEEVKGIIFLLTAI